MLFSMQHHSLPGYNKGHGVLFSPPNTCIFVSLQGECPAEREKIDVRVSNMQAMISEKESIRGHLDAIEYSDAKTGLGFQGDFLHQEREERSEHQR